jgi:urease accessory protein
MSPLLHPFRSLPIARTVHRVDALPPAAAIYARDQVTLGWEGRRRTRGRRISDHGVEFGVVLDRGVVVRSGDCFVLDEAATIVEVVEQPEAVFVLEPANAAEAALWAYQIGNCHLPLMITGTAIVCADVPGMLEVLTYHRIPFTRDERPFTPLGGEASHQHLS